jgi:hypothetical protein
MLAVDFLHPQVYFGIVQSQFRTGEEGSLKKIGVGYRKVVRLLGGGCEHQVDRLPICQFQRSKLPQPPLAALQI